MRHNLALEGPPDNIDVARDAKATAFGDKLVLVRRGELAHSVSQRHHSYGDVLAGDPRPSELKARRV